MLNKVITFLKEVKMEIKKVNWPSRQQTVRYTMIVLGISFGVSLFLGAIDFAVTALLNKLIF